MEAAVYRLNQSRHVLTDLCLTFRPKLLGFVGVERTGPDAIGERVSRVMFDATAQSSR